MSLTPRILSGLVASAFVLAYVAASVHAQPSAIQWQRYYGGSDAENFRFFMTAHDRMMVRAGSGYAFLAQTESYDGDVTGCHRDTIGNPENDFWLVRTDSAGRILWQKCFGGAERDPPRGLIQTSDNGFLLCGATESHDGDVHGNHPGTSLATYDAWLVKTDSIGTLEWAHCYGSDSGNECFNSVIETKDGFIAVGSSNGLEKPDWYTYPAHQNISYDDALVMKLNSSGQETWHRLYGGRPQLYNASVEDVANEVIACPTGGYVFVGYTDSDGGDVVGHHVYGIPHWFDIWVVKIDTVGKIVWSRCYGGGRHEIGNSIIATATGYLVGGWASSSDYDVQGHHSADDNDRDGWVLMIDTNGILRNRHCFGGTGMDVINSVMQTANGNFLFVGSTSSLDGDVSGVHVGRQNSAGQPDSTDGWVGEFSPTGKLLWQQCIGGYNYDAFFSAIESSNNELLLYGTTEPLFPNEEGSPISGYSDAWMVKLALPTLGVTQTDKAVENNFPYPNPARSEMYLDLLETASVQEIAYYDMLGSQLFPPHGVDATRIVTQVQELPLGVYQIKVSYTNGDVQVRKFLHAAF